MANKRSEALKRVLNEHIARLQSQGWNESDARAVCARALRILAEENASYDRWGNFNPSRHALAGAVDQARASYRK